MLTLNVDLLLLIVLQQQVKLTPGYSAEVDPNILAGNFFQLLRGRIVSPNKNIMKYILDQVDLSIKCGHQLTNSVIRIDLAYSLKFLYVPPLARSFSIKKFADSSISVDLKIKRVTFTIK